MKLKAQIILIPSTSTNTEPNKYILSIKGRGTQQECQKTLDRLFNCVLPIEKEKP